MIWLTDYYYHKSLTLSTPSTKISPYFNWYESYVCFMKLDFFFFKSDYSNKQIQNPADGWNI